VIASTPMPAITLAFAEGCLVPQSVDPIQTRPHTVPRIDIDNLPPYLLDPVIPLDPQESADVAASPPCHCVIQIKDGDLVLIDEDPSVDVEVRIFIDYDLNNPQSQRTFQTITIPGDFNSTDQNRPLKGDTAVNPFAASDLGGPGFHVVEMVLAEKGGFAPDSVSPPHRAVLGDFQSSEFQFVIQVLTPPVGTRQSCSDTPPPTSDAQKKLCQ
jgi:hypothetical protein